MTAIDWKAVQHRIGARVDGDPGRETWGRLLALAVGRPVDEGLERLAQSFARYGRAYGLTISANRAADTIAQLAHETQGLTRWEENLNYSAQGLANTWPGRYAVNPKAKLKVPNARAQALHRRPEAIANDTYGLRMGNQAAGQDNDANPDGWQYRGRGPTMLTGKAAYAEFGPFVGLDLVRFPELAADPAIGALIAFEFYKRKGVFAAADAGDFPLARERVNGGRIGLAAVDAIRRRLLDALVG